MKTIAKKAAKKSHRKHHKTEKLETEPPISEKDEVKAAERRTQGKTSADNS